MSNFYKQLLKSTFTALFTLCSFLLMAQRIPARSEAMVPGKILVKLRPDASSQVLRNLDRIAKNNSPAGFATGLAQFDRVARTLSAVRMKRVFPYAGRMEAKQHRYGLDRWYVLEVDRNLSVPTAISSFAQVREIEKIEPALVVKSITSPVTRINSSPGTKPLDASDTPPVNDPYYFLQWHYHNTGQVGGYPGADIDLPAAWKITSGKSSVIVDVVDQGVQYDHPDLAANMWKNTAELNGQPGVDDDGNGYIDDVYGYNFADQTGNISPGDHGTHTSGTIAAVNNNGIGVAGIAGGSGNGDGARIMSSEIFGGNGADEIGTAAAIVYGANNGAVISQNSWGYTVPGVYSQAVLDAVDYFTKEAGRDGNGNQVGPMNGGLVIFASGNDDLNDLSYPAYYPTAIAVSATTCFDNKASYSNYGSYVDISAPGGDNSDPNNSHQEIASTISNGGYGYMAGTSMACPHVSGVAALIVSQYGKPGFTNEDLRNRLLNSTAPFIAMNPAYNGFMGSGRLDAGKALESNSQVPPNTISDLAGSSLAQNSISLNWTAPADADNINAHSYVIYYAKHAFDSTEKDTLTKIFINKALTAGSPETWLIGGLPPSTDYYVSISAKDFWGNESSLSNQVKVTTQAGPVVSTPAGPLSLNINVTASPTASTSLTLTNNGSGGMTWSGAAIPVSSSWARKDGSFNDTLTLIKPDMYPSSFIGDDQRVSFSAASRIDVSKKFNLTHVANYMDAQGITAPITISIYKGGNDPSKGTLLVSQTLNQAEAWVLTVTKLNGMFVFNPGEWFWIVYSYDPAYGYIQGAQNDASPANELYNLTSSNGGKTWNTITSQYAAVNFYMLALSNEGYFGNFITLQPNAGNTPGLSSTDITLQGNGSTIRNGVYRFNVQIASNDLNNPLANVPLDVTVSGQKGTLTSKQGLLDCKTVFIGKDGDAAIKLYNSGLSTLYNFSFQTDNPLFSTVSLPDSLYPGDSVEFRIRFTPTAAGQQLAKIKLTTNDGGLNLSGSGVGVEPPLMELAGIPLQIVARVDSTGKNSFTISNKNGKFPLSFSLPEIAAVNKALKVKALAKGNDPSMDYAWIDSQEPDGPVFSWDDISKTGMDITASLAKDVKSSRLFQLGFPMKFYGDTIRELYVTSMGMLSLNYPGAMNGSSSQMPVVNDGINGMIAGLYFELMRPVIKGNEHVFVKLLPGKFIVQYNDLEYFDGNFYDYGSYSTGKATFQIVLYSNGKIEMNFKDVANASWAYGTNTGLENKDETKGISVQGYDILPSPWVPTDNTTLWFVPMAPKFIKAISPASGVVAPGDTVNIEVTATAKGLVDSSYLTSLSLTTNDPLNEKSEVPVVFTVTGSQGMMQKTDTLAFGNVYKNGNGKLEAVFLNAGTKPVQLLSVSISDAAYTTDVQPAAVPPFSELRIPVNFKPTTANAYPATMTVTTDDSAQAIYTVQLTGSGKSTPAMSWSLSGGQANTLNTGETLPAALTLANHGDADLTVMVERPQWFTVNQPGMGVQNGLDSAHSYSIHKNIDSSSAAYEWVELANGLGTPSLADASGISSEEVKLPFAFPYFGKTYTSLFINWMGDISLNYMRDLRGILPGLPSPEYPNGIIAAANQLIGKSYDWENGQYIGNIYYYADTDKLVVEYYDLIGLNYGTVGYTTFETIVYKDGRVKMMYKSGENVTNYTQTFTVGIENEDGSDGAMAYNHTLFFKDKGAIEFVPSVPYTLHPGDSVSMPANWTTTSMTDGVYKDRIRIVSNDPLMRTIDIPMELTVKGNLSVKADDSVNFGKVVAFTGPDGQPKTYTKPVLLKNDGKKPLTISSMDFNGNPALILKEQIQNPDLFTNPIVLAPGEVLKYHVVFTPDASMDQFEEFMNVNSDFGTQINILVTAHVTPPPVVTSDSPSIHIFMNQQDTAIRMVNLGNTGSGDLDYTLGIEYHRPGITYNAKSTAKPLKQTTNVQPPLTLYGSGFPAVALNAAGNFADSILMYKTGPHQLDYFGTGFDEGAFTTLIRFNGGKKGFYLSHVATRYRTDNMMNTTIRLKILLGNSANSLTTVHEQTVDILPDTTAQGIYLVAKLDSSILVNAYEDFWVEWDYAYGMRYPQAFQYTTLEESKPNTFYWKTPGRDAFVDQGPFVSYYVAAYAEQDSTGGWLKISPDNGSVAAGQSTGIQLVAEGPKVAPPDQIANVVVHSNDPATPDYLVPVFVHIDQAPELSVHDTLYVHENDTLTSLIPAADDGGGAVQVSLSGSDTSAAVNQTDSGAYFIYHPGYNDAGLHPFVITMTDVNSNHRNDSLVVMVLNTNRAPVAVHPAGEKSTALQSPALMIAMDSVFTDPDGDPMAFNLTQTDPRVKVYIDSNGLVSIIPLDTGRIDLPFAATDTNFASGYDTLHLYVKNNRAPEAADMPNMIIEKGSEHSIALSQWFSDQDENDELNYEAVADTTGIIGLSTQGQGLTVSGLSAGESKVTVTARDGNGGSVSKTFRVQVLNNLGNIVDDYNIRVGPNPVHESARIMFQLGDQKKVHIDLISMDGKLQSVLFEGMKPAGNHSIEVNFSRIAAGNYLLKFTIDDKTGVVQIAKL